MLLRSYHLVRELSRFTELDLVAFVQESWLRVCFGDVQQGLEESRVALSEFCTPRLFMPIPMEQRRGGAVRLALRSLLSDPCFTVRWLTSSDATRALQSLAAAEQYDLIHFDSISLAQYRPLFRTGHTSLGHHNVESHMLLRRTITEPNRLKAAYYRQEGRRLRDYERAVADFFDTHITCSEIDSERLREVCAHPSIVAIPNGVDVEYFRPGVVPPIENTLVFAGTMDAYANIDAMEFVIREVWPRLKEKRPGATLGIVGRNPRDSLRRVAQEDPAIRVYGFVDDVRPYLEGAALYVCPIRDGGGTRLKVLDALAMGKCIVAHPVGCEGIEVVHGRDVVLAETADEYVEKILDLLDDPDRARRIGAAGRALATQRYAFSSIGRRLAEHFAAVAGLTS